MVKRFPLILIIIALLSSLVIGQSLRGLKSDEVSVDQKNPDPNAAFYIDYRNRQIQSQQKTNAAPVDMVLGNWDWPCNSYQPPFAFAIDFTGDGVVLDPFMVATDNLVERVGLFAFIDDFGASSYNVYPGINPNTGNPWRTGWNSHLFMSDNSPGMAYIAIYDFLNSSGNINDHVWVVDMLSDPSTATQLTDSTTALEGGWARFALDGNGIFWELLDNYDGGFPQNIAVSTDGGATFTVIDSVGSNDATFWYTDFANDPGLVANGDKISFIGTLAKGGGLGGLGIYTPDVTDPDSASGIYHWYTTDGGGTWMGEMIFHDGDPVITNRPNYELNLQAWDFGAHYVDNNAVTHLVFGGGRPNSGGIVGPDTINVAPILYWNDRDKNWMSLEVEAVETYDYNSALFVGNANGPYRPNVKTDPSGQLVVALWERPQFSGEPGNSPINIYTGGTNFYHYDIVYAYSEDGGVTWSTPDIAYSVADESNYFPCIAAIEVGEGVATVHYVAYMDPEPGISLFGENSASPDAVWRYHTLEFNTILGVGDETVLASDFQLEQNYPNPFNPSTTIKYSLPEKSDVTIKIFDVLGNEVSTLLNATQDAGSHEVDFNASELASGMYIYTLKAGTVSLSKKMMLLK